jgi:hypothetical protein
MLRPRIVLHLCAFFLSISFAVERIRATDSAKGLFVWETWKDHRPIGQLILAGGARTEGNWNKWNLPNLDTRTPAGLANFKKNLLGFCDYTAQNIRNVGGQGVIIWDIEGQGHGYLNYAGDPRLLPVLAPEMEPLADQVFEIFKRNGLKVGICIRADKIKLDSNCKPVPETFQAYYTTQPEMLADLDGKITYAQKRWGCTIFYIDSNGDGGEKIGEKSKDGIYPAAVYQELHRKHPDCLLCPEQYYNNGEGGRNDSYSGVTAPYQELRVSSPKVGGVTDYEERLRTQFPGAFLLLCVSDGDVEEDMSKLVSGVRAGNILLFRSWFESRELNQVKKIYDAASKK